MTTTPASRPTRKRGLWAAIPRQPSRVPASRGHIGLIVAGSLAAGLVCAVLLVAAPFIPVEISAVTGAVLCGYALGWLLLAVLSGRFTNQPQRWAWGPALFMGVGGLLLILFGAQADDVLSWVWPPALLALVVWMVVHIHRDLRSRTGPWLLYPVIGVLAIAAIGGGYETASAARAPDVSPPGQLIKVSGHHMHIKCTGSGSPTVLLEPGAGAMSADLGWVAPAIAGNTRVCVYDRAGRGWSDPADTPQDAAQIAADLHTLLHRAHVPGPYVLAGHSFGGLYVLTYAARYPGEVAGAVLIDSTAPASSPRPHATTPAGYDAMGRFSALASSAARFGALRLYAGSAYGSLPPRAEDEERARVGAESIRSTIDEYVQAGASANEAAALTSFRDKPLFVLTAGEGNPKGWMANQNKLAALSTNSVHHVVPGAAHADFLAEAGPAATTSQAILKVVASVRSGQQLQG